MENLPSRNPPPYFTVTFQPIMQVGRRALAITGLS